MKGPRWKEQLNELDKQKTKYALIPFKKYYLYVLIFLVATLIAGGMVLWNAFLPCTKVIKNSAVAGSQGYRVWFGDTLETFEHRNKKICVPDGWEAVGALSVENGWVRFEKNKTGIFIRTDAFLKIPVSADMSDYDVEMILPNSFSELEIEKYSAFVGHVFNSMGSLFGDLHTENPTAHTVLVTVGLSGGDGAVYPDPRDSVTVLIYDLSTLRGEELFIHAVTHLYNRFDERNGEYQKNHKPLEPEDFQELEATWADTRFRSSNEGRLHRLAYLYSVHTAVQTKNFALIREPPFNIRAEFDRIQPNILVKKGTSYVNAQYGHYVLGPLTMVAIEGLLVNEEGAHDIEQILTQLHTGEAENFFTELNRYLPEDRMKDIEGWMFKGETIPRDLLETALEYYSTQ